MTYAVVNEMCLPCTKKKHNARKNDMTPSFENDIVTRYCTTDSVTKTAILFYLYLTLVSNRIC